MLRAYQCLLNEVEEWIPRSELRQRYGIPNTSVDEDYGHRQPDGDKRGKGRVEFRRGYLLEFVLYRWTPSARDAPKRT